MRIKFFPKELQSLSLTELDEVGKGSRKSLRRVLGVLGLMGGMVVLTGLVQSLIVLTISAVAVFLAVTNFGRQCPLLLSLRRVFLQIKSRRTPPVL